MEMEMEVTVGGRFLLFCNTSVAGGTGASIQSYK